jgi:hypothetical protein
MTEADEKLYGDVKRAMGMVKSIGIPMVYDDLYNFKKYLEGQRGQKPDMAGAWTAASTIAYCKDESTPEVFVKNTLESCLYHETAPKEIAASEYAEF